MNIHKLTADAKSQADEKKKLVKFLKKSFKLSGLQEKLQDENSGLGVKFSLNGHEYFLGVRYHTPLQTIIGLEKVKDLLDANPDYHNQIKPEVNIWSTFWNRGSISNGDSGRWCHHRYLYGNELNNSIQDNILEIKAVVQATLDTLPKNKQNISLVDKVKSFLNYNLNN